MRERSTGAMAVALGSALLLALPLLFSGAALGASSPTKPDSQVTGKPSTVVSALRGKPATVAKPGRAAYGTVGKAQPNRGRPVAARVPGLSCVPYARNATGIAVAGNAWQWWNNAAGLYARGQMPEAGSVLSFRSNLRMPMGHVAVVSQVAGPREVIIDHANWPVGGGRRGAVSRGISVVDVSDRNDWSAVRVELGRGVDYGSVYPTNGFIYAHPDGGAIRTASNAPAPMLALNAPPRDLRSAADRTWGFRGYHEVAEAPAARMDAAIGPVSPIAVRAEIVLPMPVFNGGN